MSVEFGGLSVELEVKSALRSRNSNTLELRGSSKNYANAQLQHLLFFGIKSEGFTQRDAKKRTENRKGSCLRFVVWSCYRFIVAGNEGVITHKQGP